MHGFADSMDALRAIDRQLAHLLQSSLDLSVQSSVGVVVSDIVGKVSAVRRLSSLQYADGTARRGLTFARPIAFRSPLPRTAIDT